MKNNIKTSVIIALILAVLGLAFLVSKIGGGHTAPYQYIRKAVRYIDEGKYEKAITLLHKAYEEMPDSAEIRENLLMGYVRYAQALESEGKLNEAINRLETAYGTDKENKIVRQYLAFFLAEKAVSLAKAKDLARSVEYLKKASGLSEKDADSRKNVAIYLYNSAVEAYNVNDDRMTALCLDASYLLRPTFEAADLMGQYFYRKGDLDSAKSYWEKALERKPDNTVVKEKLEKAEKELALIPKMSELKAGNFTIKFYKEYGADKNAFKDILARVRDDVGKDLGYYPPDNTEIILYDEKDFRDIFSGKGIVRAFYDGNIRMAVSMGVNDPFFAGTIAHEYTHAIISMMTGGNAPTWLHEGLAVLEQAKYMKVTVEDVKAAVKAGRTLTLDELDKGFESLDNESALKISYQGSYAAVSFIIGKWGWPRLKSFIKRMKDGLHYANAMDEEFYISVKMFEDMLDGYLKNMN